MNERNLVELFRRQAERLGPRPALRYKRHGIWHDMTWEQYGAESLAAAAALVEFGVAPGDRVGLVAENSVDWLIADLAILAAAAVNVPPHAPLTARQILFQLADADINFLFVSNRVQLDKVRQIHAQLPSLRGLVVFDSTALLSEPRPLGSGMDNRSLTVAAQTAVLSWQAFRQRGRRALPRLAAELARREAALGPDDLATIMYTSGTTGNPKGVMLTHGNLLSNVRALLARSGQQPGDVILSWLPYTHIYSRTVDHYNTLAGGVLLCLAESADTLVQDLSDVQPTHMASVPRFYEKVLTLVADPDPQVVGQRLRDLFGPRVNWLSSGGAPLPYPVARAYADAGLLVLQGYGLTETSPVISFNAKDAYKLETVGRPLPGVEVKIAADGEVLTRGPHVMKGYWKNPHATAESIRGGWFYTGDLGELDADGFLKITGRKKELLVLSNGKKVAPAFIEGLLQADPCIDQAVVCGEGRNFLTALIVPHWDNVRAALASDSIEQEASSAVRELLQCRIQAALSDVCSAEQVKKFLIVPQPFSVAADELTVSLKLRRNVVLAKYARQIEELYRDAI
ncbi:MAG TPA: long-chain fatty acid--CoA ligase [Gemmataceae bacterium]|nr:long-chain fatty acid--CoA ligase [Gemmataceae bacterium]